MKRKAPHHAAAREALEEAGVVGEIRKKPIGKFSHRKGKQGKCKVHVFALEVTRQRKSWREKGEREVQWFSAGKAARTVREPVLRRIIRDLHKHA